MSEQVEENVWELTKDGKVVANVEMINDGTEAVFAIIAASSDNLSTKADDVKGDEETDDAIEEIDENEFPKVVVIDDKTNMPEEEEEYAEENNVALAVTRHQDGEMEVEIKDVEQTTTAVYEERISNRREKKFSCSYCEKTFASRHHLSKHLRIHTGEKPFKCPDCGYVFGRNDHLVRHLKVHNEEKPFKCTDCNGAFKRKDHLLRHLRTHSAERTLPCDVCNKMFKSKEDLNGHAKTHTRPYKCEACDKTFAKKENLNAHTRGIHGEGGNVESVECRDVTLPQPTAAHVCPVCNKAFTRKAHVTRHLKTHTDKEKLAQDKAMLLQRKASSLLTAPCFDVVAVKSEGDDMQQCTMVGNENSIDQVRESALNPASTPVQTNISSATTTEDYVPSILQQIVANKQQIVANKANLPQQNNTVLINPPLQFSSPAEKLSQQLMIPPEQQTVLPQEQATETLVTDNLPRQQIVLSQTQIPVDDELNNKQNTPLSNNNTNIVPPPLQQKQNSTAAVPNNAHVVLPPMVDSHSVLQTRYQRQVVQEIITHPNVTPSNTPPAVPLDFTLN